MKPQRSAPVIGIRARPPGASASSQARGRRGGAGEGDDDVPLALDGPMPSTWRTEACGQPARLPCAAAASRGSTSRPEHLARRPDKFGQDGGEVARAGADLQHAVAGVTPSRSK